MSSLVTRSLDLTGLGSPEVIEIAAQAASGQPPGTLVEILATDARTLTDVASWSVANGFDLLESSQLGVVLRFVVRKRA